MTREGGVRIGLLGWAVAFFVALGGAPMAAEGQVETLTVGAAANLNGLVTFVAVDKGLFLKHGIDVKLKLLATGAELTRAIQAKDIEFTDGSNTSMAIAWERNIPLVAVVSIMGDATTPTMGTPLSVIARGGTNIRPGQAADLVGKKVGTVIGGTAETLLTEFLDRNQVTRDRVTYINVPPDNQPSVLASGSVDAVAVWEPFGVLSLRQAPGSYEFLRGGVMGYWILAVALEPTVQSRPALVQRYVNAQAEAAWFVRQNPREAAEIGTRYISGLRTDVALEAMKHMRFDSRMNANTIKSFAQTDEIMLKQKKITKRMDYPRVIRTEFLERTMKEFPQFFTDLPPVK